VVVTLGKLQQPDEEAETAVWRRVVARAIEIGAVQDNVMDVL
jgi:hypothetical protein